MKPAHKEASLRVLSHEPPSSLQGPAVNLSLLQAPMFWYCLVSLCVEHTDLRFSNSWGKTKPRDGEGESFLMTLLASPKVAASANLI